MSTQEKLIQRAKTIPKDFSFDELKTLLTGLGYHLDNKGKSSGSRVKFVKAEFIIMMHRPHGSDCIKVFYLKEIVNQLIERGEI